MFFMPIANMMISQYMCKLCLIELRIMARFRNGADIN